jgi:NAD-dependent DNA ligase
LEGYEFLVLNGNDQLDKQQIEQKIISLGGKCVQSISQDAKFLAIAGADCGIRVKNLKVSGSVDLIKVDWLLECENRSSFIQFKAK